MLRSSNVEQLAQQVHFNKWMQLYGPLVQKLHLVSYNADPFSVVADALMAAGLAEAHKHAPLQLARFTTNCLHTRDLLASLPAASITDLDFSLPSQKQEGLSVLSSGALARFVHLHTLKISIDARIGAAASDIIPDGFLSSLHSLTHLTHLELEAGYYTWGSLQTLPVNLQEVNLATKGDCLLDLAHLSCLTSLSLHAPLGFATGSAFPKSLTFLDLQNTPLSKDPVVTQLLSHVEKLSLCYSKKELAELPAELGALPSLQTIDLTCSTCQAAAAGSAAWHCLPQLHWLSIESTDDDDREDLNQVLPAVAAATSLTSLRLCLEPTDSPCAVYVGHLRGLQELELTNV
jgi:hypothetical protein